MKNISVIICFIIFTFLSFSCKKKSNTVPQQKQSAKFNPLSFNSKIAGTRTWTGSVFGNLTGPDTSFDITAEFWISVTDDTTLVTNLNSPPPYYNAPVVLHYYSCDTNAAKTITFRYYDWYSNWSYTDILEYNYADNTISFSEGRFTKYSGFSINLKTK